MGRFSVKTMHTNVIPKQHRPAASLGRACAALSAAILAGAGAIAASAAAAADTLPYGPDTCIQGLVWRGAVPSDHVCVDPEIHARTMQENADAAGRRNPNG